MRLIAYSNNQAGPREDDDVSSEMQKEENDKSDIDVLNDNDDDEKDEGQNENKTTEMKNKPVILDFSPKSSPQELKNISHQEGKIESNQSESESGSNSDDFF